MCNLCGKTVWKDTNHKKSGESLPPVSKPTLKSPCKNCHKDKDSGALHFKTMERKKPLPVKKLKEELEE